MKTFKIILLFTFSLFVLIGGQCNKTKIQEKRIKIGAILPLTGDVATYGVKIKNGITIAQEESPESIQIIYEDSKSQAKDAVSSLNKLINDSVRIVIGEVSSSNTLAISSIAEKNKTILISPSASNPSITTSGDYIFRIYPSDSFEGSELIKYASLSGYKDFYTITITNDYGSGLKQVFKETISNLTLNLINQYEYNQNETNFRTLLTKIENDKAAIVIVGYGKDLGTIIKQARELGLKNQFFSTVNFMDQNTINSGGSSIDGTIFSALYLSSNSSDSVTNNFVAKYRLKFNEEPDIWSALGFDCFNILKIAIGNKTSIGDIEEIKSNLYKIKDYPGISGNTSFDMNGDVIKPINFMTVINSKFIPIK